MRYSCPSDTRLVHHARRKLRSSEMHQQIPWLLQTSNCRARFLCQKLLRELHKSELLGRKSATERCEKQANLCCYFDTSSKPYTMRQITGADGECSEGKWLLESYRIIWINLVFAEIWTIKVTPKFCHGCRDENYADGGSAWSRGPISSSLRGEWGARWVRKIPYMMFLIWDLPIELLQWALFVACVSRPISTTVYRGGNRMPGFSSCSVSPYGAIGTIRWWPLVSMCQPIL